MEEEQAGQEKTPGRPGVFSAPVLTVEQPPDGLSRCEHRLLEPVFTTSNAVWTGLFPSYRVAFS